MTSTTDQSSSVFTPTTKAAADGQSDSLESRDESGKSQVAHSTVSTVPKNPSIRESSQERDPERRKKRSSKERTARRNSRQRDIKHSSSSDEDVDRSLTRADAKRRRRRHRESVERAALPPLNSAANGMLKSFDSTPSKVEDGTDSALKTTVRSPPLSPIKNIPPADVSTSQLASKPNDTAPSETNEDPSASKSHAPPASAELPPKSNDSDDDFFDSDESATEASSIIEDESQYSAVVHFTPKKRKVKRIAPVPGLWKVAGAEEFISKNKRLAREPCQASTTHVWKIRPRETVSKRVRMTRVPAKKVETKPIDTPNGTLPIKNGKKPLAKKDVIEPVKNGETPLLKKEVIEPVNNVEKPTVNKGVVDVAEVVEQKKKNGTSMLRKLFSGKTKEEKADEKMKNTVVETKKDLAKLEAPVVRIEKKTEPLKKVEPLIVLENKEKKMSSIVKRKPCLPKDVTVILEIPRSLKFTHPQKIRERKPLATQSVSCSLFNTAKQLEEKMTWHEKMRSLASTSLSCKATSIKNAIFSKGLTRPASYHGAQVTVDQPVPDVNVSRVRLRIKRAKKALLPHPPVENASTRRSTSVDSESTSYLCPSRQLVEVGDDSSRSHCASTGRVREERAAQLCCRRMAWLPEFSEHLGRILFCIPRATNKKIPAFLHSRKWGEVHCLS
ncbi:unnamed protein product [Heligmosomoides polygyrus]|uniref:Uncharacterized protein n=1 Tax=Heligmosomoides polygyrus TaxID=6339 RepID=A0A3P7ZN53_HELPZ|nr:unnamed protein product [Heligmosomoides polygyrus]